MNIVVAAERQKSGAAELRRAADEMEKSALNEGVDPESSLGVFVRAQKYALTKQAEMFEDFEKSLVVTVKTAQAAGASELEKLRIGLRQALELQEQAKQVVLVSQVKREDLVAQALHENWPQMVQALKPWLVWRENEFNYNEKWRTALIASVFMLFVGGGAYGLRAWQDGPATTALARCLSMNLKSSADGRRICYADQLAPSEASSAGWLGWIDRLRPNGS
jgi:hypothetical protein